MKVRRCEDEKMRERPPLLEEPCAQTLSGKHVCERVVRERVACDKIVCVTPLCFLFPPCPSHVHSCFVFLENVKFVGLSAPLIEIFNLLFLILLFYLALLWHFFWPTRAQL